EQQLDGDLPEAAALPRPDELFRAIAREAELRAHDIAIPDSAWLGQPAADAAPLREAWKVLREALTQLNEFRDHPHLLECVEAGRRGGPPCDLWHDFVTYIASLRTEIERDEALARQLSVTLGPRPA